MRITHRPDYETRQNIYTIEVSDYELESLTMSRRDAEIFRMCISSPTLSWKILGLAFLARKLEEQYASGRAPFKT